MQTKAEKRQALKDKLKNKRPSLADQVKRRARLKKTKISVRFHEA